MKSQSFDLRSTPAKKWNVKHNKTFDFVGYYKSASESNADLSGKSNSDNNIDKESFAPQTIADTSQSERSVKKTKKNRNGAVDISHIAIGGKTLDTSLNTTAGKSSPLNHSRVTSTPHAGKRNQVQISKVKSIMKNASPSDDAMDESSFDFSSHKPKKRNKSVSFMIDDNEEVAVKKTKSDESLVIDKKAKKKFKKNQQAEKENAGRFNMDSKHVSKKLGTGDNKSQMKLEAQGLIDTAQAECDDLSFLDKRKMLKKFKKRKRGKESSELNENEINCNGIADGTKTNIKKNLQAEKENVEHVNMDTKPVSKKSGTGGNKSEMNLEAQGSNDAVQANCDNLYPFLDQRKMLKKVKKRKKAKESSVPTENESNNDGAEESTELKIKKLKKKKRLAKSVQTTDKVTEEEPATKTRKKETKEDIIAGDLENLSIGDNAHSLTNLLDEMTVVDKEKKKKTKHRRKKDKTQKSSISSSETADAEKVDEKEKVKWQKRRWNKDKKGNLNEDYLITTVIVDNLPLKIMLEYKTLLADHFGKLGLIKKIGVAEVYPTEEPKPVFTTTIVFCSEDAATKALEEDNIMFAGSRVRVSRPLPPTQTTLVVRSYAALTDQTVSSVFSGAGRIRNIRHLVKGKKAGASSFIEFDGPEAVERALKMAADATIGGKKIHAAKFEVRGRHKKETKRAAESENEGDSEDSNE